MSNLSDLVAYLAGSANSSVHLAEPDFLFQTLNMEAVSAHGDPVGFWVDASKLAGATPAAFLAGAADIVDTANTAAAWTASGTNTVTDDAGEVKVTYVDNAAGAVLPLSLSGGLTADLTAGEWYVVTLLARVNTGSVSVAIQGGTVNAASVAVSSTSLVPVSLAILADGSGEQVTFSGMGSGEIIWVSAITVKALPGRHWWQSTSGFRTLYDTASGYGAVSLDGSDDILIHRFVSALTTSLAFQMAVDTDPAKVTASCWMSARVLASQYFCRFNQGSASTALRVGFGGNPRVDETIYTTGSATQDQLYTALTGAGPNILEGFGNISAWTGVVIGRIDQAALEYAQGKVFGVVMHDATELSANTTAIRDLGRKWLRSISGLLLEAPFIASEEVAYAPSLTHVLAAPVLSATGQSFAPGLTHVLSAAVVGSGEQTFAPSLTHVLAAPSLPSTALAYSPQIVMIMSAPLIASATAFYAPWVHSVIDAETPRDRIIVFPDP